MRYLILSAIVVSGVVGVACGARVSEESIRRSDRQYEAAYIAWSEDGDNLAAIRFLTVAVQENPQNDDAHYLLGTIRLGRAEYAEAEKHLSASLELREMDTGRKVETLNSLGVLYIHTERYDEAVEALREASSEVLNRAPWLAFGNLGWAYMELEKYDQAEASLKRALFEQPQFCVGLFRLGHLYYLQEKHEDAREYLQQSVSIREGGCDRIQETHRVLGMTHLRLQDLDAAVQSFETCVNIAPRTPTGQECDSARKGL